MVEKVYSSVDLKSNGCLWARQYSLHFPLTFAVLLESSDGTVPTIRLVSLKKVNVHPSSMSYLPCAASLAIALHVAKGQFIYTCLGGTVDLPNSLPCVLDSSTVSGWVGCFAAITKLSRTT
jgi:hypothetical protein